MEDFDQILDRNESGFQQQRVRYGSFWNRFFAAVIDGFIVGIPMLGMNFFIFGVTPMSPQPNFLGAGFNIVVAWLYDAYLTSTRGATIGKSALSLEVTDMYGNRITFANATGRHFAKILSGMIALIGYLMAAFTEKKQALHDIIASTVVVDTRGYY
jgi:uncharacterized RDD family membrane protein YckC